MANYLSATEDEESSSVVLGSSHDYKDCIVLSVREYQCQSYENTTVNSSIMIFPVTKISIPPSPGMCGKLTEFV